MPGFEIFGDEERREVQDVLDSGVLMRYGFDGARNGHWKALTLEKELAERLGSGYAHVCSSGTAAVATALAACGVGAGDEVIVAPFTFVADLEMILMAGAVPVFANIDETLCLDPASVSAAITDKTKAVLLVHMCGSMARVDALAALCEERGVVLIEDAAQALGGQFHAKALGTFGKVGCFSFDYVKTITCGEGGAVVTNDRDACEIIQAYTDHGHDHVGSDRGAEGHAHIGSNYRISELNAAVGVAQLRKLDRMLELQRANKAYIKDGLTGLNRVSFRHLPDKDGDSATFLSFFMPTEEEARQAAKDLAAAGVDGCFYWYDNNWHYHRRWDHLKQMRAPGALAQDKLGYGENWADRDLAASDAIMGRTICMLIKLSWDEKALAERLEKMKSVLA